MTVSRVAVNDVRATRFDVQTQYRTRGLRERVGIDVGLLAPWSVHAAHVEVKVAAADAVLRHEEEPPVGRSSQGRVVVGDLPCG